MSVIGRPCVWTMPSVVKTLYVADLNKDDESRRRAAFQLITDAAQRADNVGVDEFTQQWFNLMVHYMEVGVTLSEPVKQFQTPESLLGLLVVLQSRFCRSENPGTCQLLMFTAKQLGGRQTWRDLARLGTTLVAEARRPYAACVVEVFVPCLDHVLAFRDEGFVITACLPEAGFLAGHPGYADSYVLYKQLQSYPVNCISLMPDELDSEETSDDVTFTLRELPDYLPYSNDVDGGRTQISIRPLRRDEVMDFYAAVKDAAKSGSGFGFDELPGLRYFIRWYVDDAYNLVFELATPENAADDVVIGYNNFGPSIYGRSRNRPALFDGNIVIRPEFRGRAWLRELSGVLERIRIDCGVHSQFEDTAIVNIPGTRSLRRIGLNVCGVIPRNIYFTKFGFVDSVLYYKPLGNSRPLNNNVQSKI